MRNFELYTPVKVVFGDGETKNTGNIVKDYGKRAMLVSYAEHSFFGSLLDDIKASLKENGVFVTEFYKIQANPILSAVKEAAEICNTEQIDVVIGVGGGSVMDSAKAIAAAALYADDPWKMFVSRHDKEVAVLPQKALPIVLIPTLPATSSEMNNIAVVTNEKTTEKAYFQSHVIYAKAAIMDPSLTCSLPFYQTACGAIDAISHVLEAYLNGDQHSPVHDRIQEGLIVGIMDELKEIQKNPTDVAHRANIQWASTLCWNGWMQAGLEAGTPMHQMGHVLSARYNTTHGITLAVFMNAFFRYTANLNEERAERFATLAKRIFDISTEGKTSKKLANEFVDRFVEFMNSVEVPNTLTACGIPEEDIEMIADDIVAHGCNAEGFLPSVPPIGKSGILEILRLAI